MMKLINKSIKQLLLYTGGMKLEYTLLLYCIDKYWEICMYLVNRRYSRFRGV